MRLFNFFKGKKENNSAMLAALPVVDNLDVNTA